MISVWLIFLLQNLFFRERYHLKSLLLCPTGMNELTNLCWRVASDIFTWIYYYFINNLAIKNNLTLPMLRLLRSKAQGCRDFWKTPKPYHVGILRIALAKYSQISTHVPYSGFLHHFCIGKINHQEHKGYIIAYLQNAERSRPTLFDQYKIVQK